MLNLNVPQKAVVPPTPLTDAEILTILRDMEDVMRYRLRMSEIIPVEMARYRISKKPRNWSS